MKYTRVILLVTSFAVILCNIALCQTQITVSQTDLQPIIGSWQGTLTYLDYTTNQPFTMPANVDVEQLGRSNRFLFGNSFPNEPNANWTDTVAISNDGTKINDERVRSRRMLESGDLEIVTEVSGIDGNDEKPALLKHTYTVGRDVYVHRKDVQFVGQTAWIKRHEYRYRVRARMLTPQQMKSDLAILKSAWENIHPGIYRYNTKEQIEQYFSLLDSQTNERMDQRNFFILISQLNIKLRCGHSFVSYYNNKRILKGNLYSSVFFPLMFRVIEGKFVVTHNLSEHKSITPGDQIVSINGIPVQTIIDSLLTVSKADGHNGLNKKLDNITIYPKDISTDQYCLFDIFFPLFFKQDINATTYVVEILTGSGKSFSVNCAGLSKEKRQALFVERYGDIPKNEKSWSLISIDQSTALFRLGDFTTFNWKFDFHKYLDSVFVSLNASGYKNLIVDIRQNEGGSDEARDAVLAYLTSKPIGCANPVRRLYRYTSLPDSLLPYLDAWDESFKRPKTGYVKTPDGFYEKRDASDDCNTIMPHPHHFKGSIYLITDATNSSATFIMAEAFKRNKLGTIVGEKTGGTLQGINGGELFFFYLPNSRVEMDLPLIYQAPRSSQPDEGVVPDYEVKTTVSDIATMEDPELNFILTELLRRY